MNWKEFLKPDWRKIVIFVIILLVFSFMPTYYNLNVFDYIIWTFTGVPCPGGYCDKGLKNLIPAIVLLIMWYLISCIIVWIYHKLKKM